MESKKIYEYLVTKEWFGSLEKGIRLYYDYGKNGYIYHSEYSNIQNNNQYQSTEDNKTDYFISLEIAQRNILSEKLVTGPELGEFESTING